jgi:hypothetical protein
MDIHKPKPWHGFREFLKEYAIIVVGVLTALGAEQVAEVLHRNAEVSEARQALREEITTNASVIVFGIEEEKCLRPQVEAYAAWGRGGSKLAAMRTNFAEFRTSSWDTVKTGAVPHMPLKERLAIARFYDSLSNELKVVEEQRGNALVLFGAEQRSGLSPTTADRILDAAAKERRLAMFYAANGKSLLREAADLGIQPPALTSAERATVAWLCGHGADDPYSDPN